MEHMSINYKKVLLVALPERPLWVWSSDTVPEIDVGFPSQIRSVRLGVMTAVWWSPTLSTNRALRLPCSDWTKMKWLPDPYQRYKTAKLSLGYEKVKGSSLLLIV
jgi:hypothetical protein